ncbi:hypothetical protein QN372_06560 [Undibacterium sp. RTI2.1]|uniref:hypothetical protein n=1 Tax=unclassified Undibacterium TaxID=2630295 RepID=UPI002AB3E76F|nr:MULTISPECIES: hypothetical protein [unclassified Undibacterium]MDY7537065.1 hypothetical protein [Undibacterium sp. 5I1]MEB0030399.1 hypothetical protein [Undibacterium sp. RTI2.1]MEB0115181.1 hypothetical protein [Undibacterium sp. RTI2.2]MEB0229243.1 hypothetical protein [Undibacterium sp. 10I3]MEB0256209.1 hypothetical protein [Undibacterium sp. 5I1]
MKSNQPESDAARITKIEDLSHKTVPLIVTLFWVALLGLFFAQTEIQIEGGAGWAANLPTWRIEHHWLLDIFWGGRPMTGYHAWVFPFISMFFHFPFFFSQRWTLKLEARALACIMMFWIVEDFLWFVFNPAYGLARFDPKHVAWHKNWFLFAPSDYWNFLAVAAILFWFSYRQGTVIRQIKDV